MQEIFPLLWAALESGPDPTTTPALVSRFGGIHLAQQHRTDLTHAAGTQRQHHIALLRIAHRLLNGILERVGVFAMRMLACDGFGQRLSRDARDRLLTCGVNIE